MTWFKVDDSLAFHAKVVRAGNAAMGLWVRAGAWCAQQLSDGTIPADIARTLGKPSEIKRLVAVGLWDEIDSDSYQFHDWFQSNPSRVEVEQRRAVEAKKKADARARRAGQGRLSPGDSPVDTGGTPPGSPTGIPEGVRSTRPDPTRPDPSSNEEEEKTVAPRKHGRRIPDDFQPTDALTSWAHERGFNDAQISEMTERFADHWAAASGSTATKHDWPRAWRNWVAKEDPRRVRGAVTPIRPGDPHAGMKKQAEVAPGVWQDCHPEGFYMGKKTRWVAP